MGGTGITKVIAGPIPKSWASGADSNEHAMQAWRIDALSVVLSHLPSESNSATNNLPSESYLPPPLTLLCLRLLLSSYTAPEFTEYIVPYLPPHLRRDLLRYTAVHAPLSTSKLYALCEPEGHADGELIVIGPQATLRADHFRHHADDCGPGTGSEDLEFDRRASMEMNAEEAWDVLDDEPTPLRTLFILSCHISTPTLLTLPPTLTTLALVNLSSLVPLHRLPGICPLLSILDLSYNHWQVGTGTTVKEGNPLDRVDWSRWTKLRVLALRGCYPRPAVLEKINQGRWTDVEIIL